MISRTPSFPIPLADPVAPPFELQAGETIVPEQGIRSNLVWMITGTMWSGFCQWILLVALAKVGTVDMVGAFTLGMALTLPVLMFSCLNLRALYITDCAYRYRFREYLALRLLTAGASVIFVVAVAAALRYPPTLVFSIGLISLAKALEYVSDILYSLLQREERMAGISISMILRGTLSVCCLGVGVYATGSLVWGSVGLAASSAFTLLAFDMPTCLAFSKTSLSEALSESVAYVRAVFACQSDVLRRLGRLALSGVPLGVVLMLVSLNLNIPRYFIERSLGMRELGIFASISNLMAAGSVAVSAFGQCISPRLAKHFAAGRMRQFSALLWLLVLASFGLGVAGLGGSLIFGRRALEIIYRPEYGARQEVLVWLMAASGMLYVGITLGFALTAVRCFTPQLTLFSVSAASTALACMFLVPVLGLRGAAFGILLSSIIQCAGGAVLLKRACKASIGLRVGVGVNA
jgi:O-antigen/teichoic acid export membrane protein